MLNVPELSLRHVNGLHSGEIPFMYVEVAYLKMVFLVLYLETAVLGI